MPFIDYYEILQVSPKAHTEVIRSAYRTMMSKLNNHPDKGGDDNTAKLINEAYDVLSNIDKRKMYDEFYNNFSTNSGRTDKNNNENAKVNKKISIKELHTIYGHTRKVDLISMGNNDNIIASCNNSGIVDSFFGMFSQDNYNTEIKLWDANSGQELDNFFVPDSSIKSLKLSESKNLCAIGTSAVIKIFDLSSSEEIFNLDSNGGSFRGIDFSKNLDILSIGVDSGAQVFNIWNGDLLLDISYKHAFNNIWVSDSGGIVAATCTDFEDLIHIWEIETQKKLRTFPISDSDPQIVAINEKNSIIAISDNNSSVVFWNYLTGKKVNEIFIQSEKIIFSPQNNYFLSGDRFGVLKLFELENLTELVALKAHNEEITSICFSSDEKRVITGSKDQSIKVWEVL